MPSFSEALYSLPTQKLQDLIRLRGVDPRKLALVPDKRSLVQLVAGELSKQLSVDAAIKQCSARELRLLQIAISVENSRSFTWSQLVEMAGGPTIEPALVNVVDRLEQLGLAFRVSLNVFVPDMVRRQMPASLSDRYTLARLLNVYDAPAIRRIVDKIGLEQDLTTKSTNIEAIRSYLLASLPNLRLNPALTDAELGVIDYLVKAGGSATPFEIAAVVTDGTPDDFFRYEWQNRWKQGKERNAVDSLLARGIIHVTTSGYGYNLFLVIPGDVLQVLTGTKSAGFWTNATPNPTELPHPPSQSRRHHFLVRDVVCMLSFFGVQSAARTNTGHIHKASLKAISRVLSIPEERYCTFLYAVCREAGLAAPEGERQTYALTDKGSAWLHRDSEAQTRDLYEAWRIGSAWAEMYAEPLIKNSEYRHRDVILAARNCVLKLLGAVPSTGKFVSIDSMVSALTFHYPLLLSDCGAVSPGSVITQVSFVRQLIADCLFWLGLAETGADSAESTGGRSAAGLKQGNLERNADYHAVAFRLTQLGTAILCTDDCPVAEAEPREDKFVVQANAEVYIPPYLQPWILYRLLLITDLPSRGAAGATTMLTRESIRRALDLGETPGEMLKFLQTHSRTAIPQNVEYLINEVGGKHGHIRIGSAHMYLTVDSPILMKELTSRRELKGYFVRTLNDTVAILNCDDLEKILKELRKAGYLPISDESVGARRNGHVTENDNSKFLSVVTAERARLAPGQDPYASVDWGRIARDDDKPWHVQSAAANQSVSMPQGAYDNPSLIRVMLHNACITHNVVDMVCRQVGQEPARMFFEPVKMTGNTVRGFSQHSDQVLNLEIEAIRWARLTPEKF